MLKPVVYAVIAAAALSAPAFAQTSAKPAGAVTSAADCDGNFKRADANNDGMLSSQEIAAAKAMVPTSLSTRATIAKQDFLSACQDSVKGKVK